MITVVLRNPKKGHIFCQLYFWVVHKVMTHFLRENRKNVS